MHWEKQDEVEDGQVRDGERTEEETEERIRNGRTHNVEGNSVRDREQVEVKGGKGGEKSGSPF